MLNLFFLLSSICHPVLAQSNPPSAIEQPAPEICYFLPPAGWEIAQPKNLSHHVQVGFLGKGSGDFRPSINIAFEEVDVPLKEYVKAVKKIQTAQPNTQWRDLGKFPMKAGAGRLTEITTTTAWGEIKMLQALFVKNGMAYILTGAVLKQDLPKFQTDLLNSFRSLTLVPHLFSPLPENSRTADFLKLFSSLGHFSSDEDAERAQKQQWDSLQKAVQNVSEMGPYWDYLVLKEGHAKIYSSAPSSNR